ncbi:hypothetical protein [Maribacter polysaccharolyticus]|uniref:hypothetical protein n=1 Tax=Maribacter polysaccharolyticus TaxID=3020831 RepID=UPI00237F904E|nr:hypothetical protein [Maribacter polysaccharolyticus]MDE3740536.1 hypothetical protein [Maribacter polysaccharolyticus]
MRTLTNTRGSADLEPKENVLVHQMERNLNDVNRLRKNLDSYICEPQTYGEFDRIESLRMGLETYSQISRKMIRSLKEHKETAQGCIGKFQDQYAKFRALRQGVKEYMGLAKAKYIH